MLNPQNGSENLNCRLIRLRNVLESGLGLRGHVGADLDEADVGGAARAAVLGLVDFPGAVAAVDVAAVGHVELGLGRRRPLVAAVAVDPEEGHGDDLYMVVVEIT